MHVCLVQVSWEHFYIATTTVDFLLVLDCKLNDKGFSLIAEGLKSGRGSIETSILAGLET